MLRSLHPSSTGYECYETDFGTVMIKVGDIELLVKFADSRLEHPWSRLIPGCIDQ